METNKKINCPDGCLNKDKDCHTCDDGNKYSETYSPKDKLLKILLKHYLDKNKLDILNLLTKSDSTYDAINTSLNLSLPLIAYHLNGKPNFEGLVSSGLVDKSFLNAKAFFSLSLLGKEILTLIKHGGN